MDSPHIYTEHAPKSYSTHSLDREEKEEGPCGFKNILRNWLFVDISKEVLEQNS